MLFNFTWICHINRITVEFKVRSPPLLLIFVYILIESQWNLKRKLNIFLAIGLVDINRITVEFKDAVTNANVIVDEVKY